MLAETHVKSRTLKAVIFDFDGVLADTEPLHLRGFQTILQAEGISFSESDYFRDYVGLTDAECFTAVCRAHDRHLSRQEVDQLIRRKSAWMLHAIPSYPLVIPGMTDFVKGLTGKYRLAVASCALRDEIVLSLQVAGLIDAFEVIAAAEDARAGKPDPSVYLYALNHMKRRDVLTSADCLAVEDTPIGIQAAQRAGLKCLAVTTTYAAQSLRMANAVVPSIPDCDFRRIVRRLWG